MTNANTSGRMLEWRQALETIYQDFVGLHHDRHVFREIMTIVENNPALQTDHTFWNWLARNYGAAIALGVRRQADRAPDVVSLAKLLDDLENNATILTRDWFVGEYAAHAPDNDKEFWAKGGKSGLRQICSQWCSSRFSRPYTCRSGPPPGGRHACAALRKQATSTPFSTGLPRSSDLQSSA
jgi:hypothetical protein